MMTIGDRLELEHRASPSGRVPEAAMLTVGQVFEDRRGDRWRIIETDGQRIAPVTGARWVGKYYQTRTFQRDGRYWPDADDPWDLVREVSA